MFTGIVDDVGVIESIADVPAGIELRVRSRYPDVVTGESIALAGVCLTVREAGAGWFSVAAMTKTLERTTIGEWRSGRRVNLERAARLGDRLGGHLVQGHADAVALVKRVERADSALLIDVAVDSYVAGLVVLHGSITVDGVSLTVNALPGPGVVQVAIIEYTERHTTLGSLQAGDRVNVEADIIGKYVKELVNQTGDASRGPGREHS